MDFIVNTCAVNASYLCMKRCGWLSSRWTPVLRVPTFLSSVSASLSASPPLIWLQPWVDVYFILVSSEPNKSAEKCLTNTLRRFLTNLSHSSAKASRALLFSLAITKAITYGQIKRFLQSVLLIATQIFLWIFQPPKEWFKEISILGMQNRCMVTGLLLWLSMIHYHDIVWYRAIRYHQPVSPNPLVPAGAGTLVPPSHPWKLFLWLQLDRWNISQDNVVVHSHRHLRFIKMYQHFTWYAV